MEEVLVFPSTYHMLRSEELLKRRGYSLRLVPAPPQAGERCTTAIAVSAREREEIVRYLEGEMVLITAVLPYEGRLERFLAQAVGEATPEASLSPALKRLLSAVREGKRLMAGEIAEMLAVAESEEGEAVLQAAEKAARAYFGGRVTALVALELRADRGEVLGLRDIAGLAAEMGRQGLAHLLIDLGDVEEIAWRLEEIEETLGGGVIAMMSASSLSARAGELVGKGAVRQYLVRRGGFSSLGTGELAEEIAFLRENRLGPIGSGNLIPFLDRDMEGAGKEAKRRLRAVLAVCRLVLGDAFLPAPEALWREGRLAGANMPVLQATGKPLSALVAELEESLRGMGMHLLRASRGEGRDMGYAGESGESGF